MTFVEEMQSLGYQVPANVIEFANQTSPITYDDIQWAIDFLNI